MNDEKLNRIERRLDALNNRIKENTLAMEMLKEMKIIIIILIIAFLGSNIAWLIYESQWETVVEETTQSIEDVETPSNSNFTQIIN